MEEERQEQPYEVEVERSVTKGLRRMDRKAAEKLAEAIKALATDPRPEGTKALVGPLAGHYRLRISAPGGEYRVVWTIDDKARRVEVVYAGPREGTY
jgi:mRNA interferase RelE/StbE